MVCGSQAVPHISDQDHDLHSMLCARLVCGALTPLLGSDPILVKQHEYLLSSRKQSQPGVAGVLYDWF